MRHSGVEVAIQRRRDEHGLGDGVEHELIHVPHRYPWIARAS
jgi:hypothetical protein